MLAAAFGNHAVDDREQWIAGAEGFIKRAGRGSRHASLLHASMRVRKTPAMHLRRWAR